MHEAPLVSIVIPVYNGADFLREAIDSALAQTFPDIEVIVVDDGSDDGGETGAIACSFGGRVRYFRQENGGVASALNSGIREMRGNLFCWLSHDDIFLPDKVALQVERMKAEAGDVVLYSDYEVVDREGRFLATFRAGNIRASSFRRALVADTPVNGCTVMAPRRLIGQAGYFDERLRATQDIDLWFRMAAACRFVHMAVPLLRSRVHPGQGTRSMPALCLDEGNALLVRLLETLAVEAGADAAFDRFLLYAAVRLRQRGYALAAERALAMHLDRACAGQGLAGAVRGAFARLVCRGLDRRPFRGLLARALGAAAARG